MNKSYDLKEYLKFPIVKAL